jgi:hypothetical protein
MGAQLNDAVALLGRLSSEHSQTFPKPAVPKVLSFTATTSRPDSTPAVAVRTLEKLEAEPSGRELRVTLRGALPRMPARGEGITLCLADLPRFRGYQVKTVALPVAGFEAQLLEARGEQTMVRGRLVYTIHHGPNEMVLFERIPFDEVSKDLGDVRYAVVAIGEQANLSPRFVFHHEVRAGKLLLFHGDGYPKKTYLNIQKNALETRVVLDLRTMSGLAISGRVEELAPGEEASAVARVAEGFAAGGWGKPLRYYRFAAERFEAVAPA